MYIIKERQHVAYTTQIRMTKVKVTMTRHCYVCLCVERYLVKCCTYIFSKMTERSYRMYVSSGLEVMKLEFNLKLKIKCNDWLLADTCPQAANRCRLYFEFETVLKFYNLNAWTLKSSYTTSHNSSIKIVHASFVKT